MTQPDILGKRGPAELRVKLPPFTLLLDPKEAPAELLKPVKVIDGRLVSQIPQGEVGVELYALPAGESRPEVPFLQRVFSRKKAEQPTPVQLAIEPTVEYDEFRAREHTPLMGQYPHAVLQDGTRYMVVVTAPTGVVDQEWSEPQERTARSGDGKFGLGAYEDGIYYDIKEVYRQKKGLALLVRVDGKHPLAQQQVRGLSGGLINQEMLLGGFEPSARQEGVSFLGIDGRVTQTSGGKTPDLGEEVQRRGTKEALVFTTAREEDAQAAEKKKGLVEVIVAEVTEDEVSQVIKTPRPEVLRPESGLVDYGGLKSFNTRGFLAGETTFAQPKREKVNVTSVRDLRPIAAFRMVLVAESVQEGLEMAEAYPQAT